MHIVEADDIELAEELIFSPCGLMLQRIPEEPGKQKTPDFQVLSWRGLFGFCELKSPTGDDWLGKMLTQAKPGEIVGGVQADPTFNRIDRHIRAAVKQFDAVNMAREFPNIIVFANHDPMSVPSDLYETITGHFPADDGSRIQTIPHVANRLLASRNRFDLCIWVDARKRSVEGIIFVEGQPDHRASLKEAFRQIRFSSVTTPNNG